jgi:hypothetical protein
MQNIRHISTAADAALKFIKNRKEGKERSLKVSHTKLNSVLLDGIP